MAMAGGGDGSGDDEFALIFVYGTLKRGFHNHTLLDDLIRTGGATYLGTCSTYIAYPLVCGPHGIPYLINLPESGHRVQGELYQVPSARALARLDELEGVERGHYERLPLPVAVNLREVGKQSSEGAARAEAYFAHKGFGEELWKRCGEIGLIEFDVEMGKRYVRREDRPLDHSFLDDIHKFILEGST